jgi:hypothetical protein
MSAPDLPIIEKLTRERVFRLKDGGPIHKQPWNPDGPEAAEVIKGLYDGCNALLGLIQLLAANPDTPPALLRILTESHRIAEAEQAVSRARGEEVGNG